MNPQAQTSSPAPQTPNVLFVDGQKGMEMEVGKWLEKKKGKGSSSFNPVFAKNARQALEELGKQPFKLIILEITLPVISGYHLLEILKHFPSQPLTAVYTQLTGKQDLVRIVQCAVDNVFLKKLTSLPELLEWIESGSFQADVKKKIDELKVILEMSREEEKEKRSKFTQCPRCHLIISPKAHFCNNCGQKIFKKAAGSE